MNEIRPKGCKHSMRRKRCVTSKWELNPITKPTTIAFLLKTASNFHLPFTVAHTQMEHFLWMRQWACGKYDLLSVDVCETSDRGACVHNSFLWPVTSRRLMVRNVQRGGNLSDVLRPERKRCHSTCLCGCHTLKTTLTSLGRGSWACGWTWALGWGSVGGCWLLNGSSISPPDWWALLKKKKKKRWVSFTHLQQKQVWFQRKQIT